MGCKKLPPDQKRRQLGCKVAPETFARLRHICSHGKQSQGKIIDELVEKRYNQLINAHAVGNVNHSLNLANQLTKNET